MDMIIQMGGVALFIYGLITWIEDREVKRNNPFLIPTKKERRY